MGSVVDFDGKTLGVYTEADSLAPVMFSFLFMLNLRNGDCRYLRNDTAGTQSSLVAPPPKTNCRTKTSVERASLVIIYVIYISYLNFVRHTRLYGS